MELIKFKNKEYVLMHVEMKVVSTDTSGHWRKNQTFAYK